MNEHFLQQVLTYCVLRISALTAFKHRVLRGDLKMLSKHFLSRKVANY